MGFCATELRNFLKIPRALDLHGVSARLDARLYQATGSPLRALVADILAACNAWRHAAHRASHVGQEKAAPQLPPGARAHVGFDRFGALARWLCHPRSCSACDARTGCMQGVHSRTSPTVQECVQQRWAHILLLSHRAG